MDFLKEIVEQLGMESPLHLFNGDVKCSYYTTRSQQGLLTNTYSRRVTKSKSLENRLRKAYNLLKDKDLIPKDMKSLSATR